MEERKVLEKIVTASEEFLQYTGSKINYQNITDIILSIDFCILLWIYFLKSNKYLKNFCYLGIWI